MITELAADILARIKTVPTLEESTSLSIGGRSGDPGLVKIPLPACWITFAKDESDEQSYTHGPSSGVVSANLMMMTFAAPFRSAALNNRPASRGMRSVL